MRLLGKTVIVTGGSLGIGKAIALKFIREGARVAISGRNPRDLEAALREMEEAGGEAMMVVSDVSSAEQVHALFNAVEQAWEPAHIVVNNAGICEISTFLDITVDAWQRHMDINLTGTFLVGQTAARRMVQHGIKGSIINMSSVNGISAEPNQAHYNASKGGINLLSMSMAVELAEYGIRVNALCPGFIATRLTQSAIDDEAEITEYLKTIPMKRVGQSEEIADAALFMASEESRYMTGHCLVIDGGQVVKLA
jgi:NAD(P)-dependent dehydrogenase (short-subunit alcohol dehydrogenase family)